MSNLEQSVVDDTAKLMGQARRLLAYGDLDSVGSRPLLDGEGGVFPHFAVAAEGCRLTDSTGQSYIDWINGWGPVLLGYRHPGVEQAIIGQLRAGPSLSLMHPLEIALAERITEMVPCAEMVAFGKNGSDSVTAALRIARAATGRDVILQCGFHGFHDWNSCLQAGVKGILPVLKEYVDSFAYNDLKGLTSLFKKYKGRIAAVILEPVNIWLPEKGFLEGVRELTAVNGSLLIFDEMITAFRLARGGAQELYGVVPDLACLGRAMGNGMPLSAVCGRRDYMQLLPACGFGMTFRGETLSLAAAAETLRVVRDENVVEHLAAIGESIRIGFHAICNELEVRCQLSGPPARMTFVFHDQGNMSWSALRDLFVQECLKRKVLTNGNLMPSFAHDDSAVQETLVAFRAAMMVVRLALAGKDGTTPFPVGGKPSGPRALIANGYLDHVIENPASLHVGGWILLGDFVADRIELISAAGLVVTAKRNSRPDLSNAFPRCDQAENAGWQATLPDRSFADKSSYRFTISAFRGEQRAFQCVVNYRKGQQSPGPWALSDGVLFV
jgi:glutamate-1-semialdehyde aminotransferase